MRSVLRGGVAAVGVRGQVMYQDGKLVGAPGTGRYLRGFPQLESVASLS